MITMDWSINLSDLFTLLIGLGTILLACVAIRYSKAQLALGLLGERPSLTWEIDRKDIITYVHFTIHNGYRDYLYISRLRVLQVLGSQKRVHIYRDAQETEDKRGIFLSGVPSARVQGRSIKPNSSMKFSVSVIATSPSEYKEAILADIRLKSEQLPWIKSRIQEMIFIQVNNLEALGLRYSRDWYFMTIFYPVRAQDEGVATHNTTAKADGSATA